MSKTANHWEVPLSPFIPYLQWGEIADKRANTWDTKRHNHVSYELHIVMVGQCNLLINNSEVSLQTGQGIIITPGTSHAPNGVSSDFLRLSVSFVPDSSLSGYLPKSDDFLVFSSTGSISFLCSAIFNELKQADSLLHEELLSSQFSQLMVHVLRAIGKTQKQPQKQRQDTKFIDEMAIIEHFFVSTPPKLRTKENLAKLLYCSQRQVLRKIQTLYGISFQKKQTLSRLDTAQHLLQTTDKSIDEISHIVGYSDSAAFYRAFKLYTKTTPVKYRKYYLTQQDAQQSAR